MLIFGVVFNVQLLREELLNCGTVLQISNLPDDGFSDQDIKKIVQPFGKVSDLIVLRSRNKVSSLPAGRPGAQNLSLGPQLILVDRSLSLEVGCVVVAELGVCSTVAVLHEELGCFIRAELCVNVERNTGSCEPVLQRAAAIKAEGAFVSGLLGNELQGGGDSSRQVW